MQIPAETLSDGVILLRRWWAGDAELLHRLVNESLDHLAPWMPWAVDGYTERDAREFLTLTRESWLAAETFDYAIVAPDGAVAGSCGLMARIGRGGLEVGYWLAKVYTGRGWATRAARLLTDEAFRVGANRVEIVHDVANHRSGAVPARLGFTRLDERPTRLPGGTAATGRVAVWRKTAPGGSSLGGASRGAGWVWG
ncbi:GNAT family N-acetyltransferase [Amycolatopsis tucumanensis]|uniref:GNAT family N-acetyltransferase n=1 Tax=Amycolatopsis tucumanensis TaxID=401106 RepID=A0ABP7H8H0_9PSEU|nr:GNAT family N-acetyltransferase [Amycolatopsis tucumanensis]MCF6425569.1 GNAT family N-acetyltransferase [Amycolatopsis tucumanensis]